MADATELADLLFQLRAVDTPLKKLKVLAHAWRTVRRLTPRERRDIAAHIGLDEAERLIEHMGVKDGAVTPALLLEAIHGAEKADPVKLRTLLASLRDPEGRHDLIARTVAAASAALAAGETETVVEPATPPPAPPWLPPVLASALADEGNGRDHDGEEEVESRLAPSPPPSSSEQPAAARSPGTATIASAAPPSAPPPAQPQAPEPRWGAVLGRAPSPPTETATAPVGKDRPAGSLLARLADLHRNRLRLASLPLAPLLALCESFTDGWQRRRAIQTLLSTPAPPALPDALALIETLAAQRDRTWCLSLILASGAPGHDDIERLLDLADSPALRRRLTRRQRRTIQPAVTW